MKQISIQLLERFKKLVFSVLCSFRTFVGEKEEKSELHARNRYNIALELEKKESENKHR